MQWSVSAPSLYNQALLRQFHTSGCRTEAAHATDLPMGRIVVMLCLQLLDFVRSYLVLLQQWLARPWVLLYVRHSDSLTLIGLEYGI
jgi:hypothetical protein